MCQMALFNKINYPTCSYARSEFLGCKDLLTACSIHVVKLDLTCVGSCVTSYH